MLQLHALRAPMQAEHGKQAQPGREASHANDSGTAAGPLGGRFLVRVLVSHHVVKERLDERLSRARHGVLHLFEAPNSIIAVNDALP